MVKRPLWLSLLILLPFFSAPTMAKSSRRARVERAATGDGKKRSDPEMRTLLRKHAPFYMEERFRGDTIRLNKDGTFSREGEAGAYSTEGHWKISSGKLKLQWTTGESYGYRMAFSGRTPVIAGRKPNKQNRYVLTNAD